MTFNDILDKYGTVADTEVFDRLFNLGNNLYGKNNWDFIQSYDSETITSHSGRQHYVTIGEIALYDGCNETECNKAAYVLAVKDMYHEQRHVWQYTKAWNDKTVLNSVKSHRQTTDIVRRKFIGDYFPSVYYNNYSNDPSEMDAERYGIKMALAYFESDPIISKQDAEEMLYQLMISDNCVHKEMLDLYKDKFNSIYDILGVFEEQAKIAASVKYQITDKIISKFENDVSDEDLAMTRKYITSDEFKEYRKAFSKCKTGIEQDKVLEQVILVADHENFKRSPLRLRDELIECRRQMELGTPGTGLHAISPKRINYSIQNASEYIELTEEDIAAIPMDDNNMKL